MWDKKLIYDTILALILQILFIWIILGTLFHHPIMDALIESMITQILSVIVGITFLIMMFKKR